MAAPGFRAVGTFASGTSACSPGLPSGWAENDILMIIAEADEEATINVPSGYTHAVSGITGSGTTGVKGQVMVKRATASESAPSVTGPTDHVHAVVAAISGVNTSGAVTAAEVMTIGAMTGNPAATAVTLTIPAITVAYVDALVALNAISTFNGNSTTLWSGWTNANLTALTERQDQAETTGRGGGTGLATGTKATTGDIGTSTVTHTSAVPVVGGAIAFYPPASAPSHTASCDLAMTLQIDTVARIGPIGITDNPYTLGIDTIGRIGPIASSDNPLAFAIDTTGRIGPIASLDLPLVLDIVTDGVRAFFGVASLDMTFQVDTVAKVGPIGIADIPLGLTIDTVARVGPIGIVAVPLSMLIDSTARIGAAASSDLAMVFTVDSVGRIGARGIVDLALLFDIYTNAVVSPGGAAASLLRTLMGVGK